MTSPTTTGPGAADDSHDAQAAVSVPWAGMADYRCFGCSPHNPSGFALVFHPDPEGLRTTFRLDRRYESYPGIVHGGLVGVVCDETMGNLIVLRTGTSAYTTSLRTRYVAPLRTDVPYTCRAGLRAEPSDGGLLHASAAVEDESGHVMATATAVYQPFSLDAAREQFDLTPADAALLARTLRPATRSPDVPSALR